MKTILGKLASKIGKSKEYSKAVERINTFPDYDKVPGWHNGHKDSFCAILGCRKGGK